MSDLIVLRGLLLAGEAGVASTFLAAFAFLAARAYPLSAGKRRLVFVALFTALLPFPVLTVVAPSAMVVRLPATVSAPVVAVSPAHGDAAPVIAVAASFAIWLGGGAVIGLVSLCQAAALELRPRRGVRSTPETYGLEPGGYELRFAETCPGPMTWGILRPVIMMPQAALAWPPMRLRSVLQHELAHVRARDSLVQLLALVGCALFWPNPFVWLAARRLRLESEQAADDAVIASGVKPSDYACDLLDLAQSWKGQPAVLAMAAPAALGLRVQSILSPTVLRTGASRMDAFKLICIGSAATAALAMARPTLAETAAAPAPSVTPSPVLTQGLPPVASTPPKPSAAPVSANPPVPAHKPHQLTVKNGKVIEDGKARPMTPEERVELKQQLAEIGPTVAKAIADAHVQETVAKAVITQQERTNAEVRRQLADLGPMMQAQIAQRMAEMQLKIDVGIAKTNARAEAKQQTP